MGRRVGVLLPGIGLDEATRLAEELRGAPRRDRERRDATVPALGAPQTASFGVSTYSSRIDPARAFDFVNALEREAKHDSRNRVVARAFAE